MDSERSQIPQCLVISGLERASSAVWTRLVDILLKGYIYSGESKATGRGAEGKEGREGNGQAVDGGEDVGDEREMVRRELPDGFWVIWVRDEDKSEDCYSWLVSPPLPFGLV